METQLSGLSREVLIAAILEFLADQDLLTLRDIGAALEREIDSAGPDALLALKARLVADDQGRPRQDPRPGRRHPDRCRRPRSSPLGRQRCRAGLL